MAILDNFEVRHQNGVTYTYEFLEYEPDWLIKHGEFVENEKLNIPENTIIESNDQFNAITNQLDEHVLFTPAKYMYANVVRDYSMRSFTINQWIYLTGLRLFSFAIPFVFEQNHKSFDDVVSMHDFKHLFVEDFLVKLIKHDTDLFAYFDTFDLPQINDDIQHFMESMPQMDEDSRNNLYPALINAWFFTSVHADNKVHNTSVPTIITPRMLDSYLTDYQELYNHFIANEEYIDDSLIAPLTTIINRLEAIKHHDTFVNNYDAVFHVNSSRPITYDMLYHIAKHQYQSNQHRHFGKVAINH